jgi:hypothetical protein
MFKSIEKLSEFANERQKEILSAIASEGNRLKAADKLGIPRSTVYDQIKLLKQKAAQQGWSPEHDLNHPVPDGFKLKGTSTLYDMVTGEAKIQWVKSNADTVRQEEIFREALEAMAEALPRAEKVEAPETTDENLAVCYPVGDHHFGQLSWSDECGDNYNIKIGKQLLMGAMDHLIDTSPNCDTGIIILLGDFMHYDSFEAVTPAHKNLLDADGRFPKMVRAAIKTIRYMISKALAKHKKVHVIIEIGNHDTSSSIFLMECMHNIYEDEPRITIDRSPSHYHYFRFGKCLIATHHGDKSKFEKLPLIMAADRPTDWGETEFRYWLTGHIHHDSVKDFNGVKCESFRVLAAADAYATISGYRAGRDMKAIVYHKHFGEVARHTVNPRMLQ